MRLLRKRDRLVSALENIATGKYRKCLDHMFERAPDGTMQYCFIGSLFAEIPLNSPEKIGRNETSAVCHYYGITLGQARHFVYLSDQRYRDKPLADIAFDTLAHAKFEDQYV